MVPAVTRPVVQLELVYGSASPVVPMAQLIIALFITHLVIQLLTVTPGAFATFKVPPICELQHCLLS
jgi:hypothetical protein